METKDYLKKIASEAKQKTEHVIDSGIGWRAASIAISLLFFHFYSKIIFVVFMGKEGFFSYDLFYSGGIGMEVFFATIELMMIIFSASLFGIAIPLFAWAYKKERSWQKICCWGLGNLLMLTLSSIGFYESKTVKFYEILIIFAIAFFIALHIATVVHRPAKKALRSLMILIVMLVGFTFTQPEQMSHLLQVGLSVYGAGGDLPIVVTDQSAGTKQGTLVFLSPENIFLRLTQGKEITTIRRDRVQEFTVSPKNKSTAK